MDNITQWRSLIKQSLSASPYYVHGTGDCESESVCIFDEAHDHYLIMDVGWEGVKHVSRIIVHVRIKNGKIGIEEDWTEEGITAQFLRAGVRNEDIVLAFQHPSMRQNTDFAVA